MSCPRYPKYKDSGVGWIGEVPEHWTIARVKNSMRTCSGGTPNTSQQDLYYTLEDTGIPWVRTTDLKNDVLRSVEVFITERALADTACSVLPAGTVMVAMYGGDGTVGKNGMLAIPAAINQAVCGLLPAKGCCDEYVFRYMQFYRPYWMITAESSRKDPNISQQTVGNAPFLVPPLVEQKAIAGFLGRETAKIDELVAEQRRLMELLKEKRQAVISHAVAKGLNPRTPMKPSGIEWLGEVPAHWRITPLKWATSCCSGDGLSSLEVESLADEDHRVPVIGGNGEMGFTHQGNIEHGVLAVGRVGALCGNVHVVATPAWITDNALILDPDPRILDLHFLAAALRCRTLNDIASRTAQPLITGSQVGDQRIAAPPLDEQREVVGFIALESSKFDALYVEAQRAITLLQERRTALISAAVTGQIDVRNLSKGKAA